MLCLPLQDRAAASLSTFGPDELSMLLTAFAQLRRRPSEGFLAAAARDMKRRMNYRRSSTAISNHALVSGLWALARIQYRPTKQWLQLFEFRLQGRINQLAAADLASATWALSYMWYKPSPLTRRRLAAALRASDEQGLLSHRTMYSMRLSMRKFKQYKRQYWQHLPGQLPGSTRVQVRHRTASLRRLQAKRRLAAQRQLRDAEAFEVAAADGLHSAAPSAAAPVAARSGHTSPEPEAAKHLPPGNSSSSTAGGAAAEDKRRGEVASRARGARQRQRSSAHGGSPTGLLPPITRPSRPPSEPASMPQHA